MEDADYWEDVLGDAPTVSLARPDVVGAGLVDVSVAAGAATSKAEVRRLIKSGGMYLNQQRVDDAHRRIEEDDVIGDRLIVLRKGRKNYTLIKVTQ